MDQIKIGSFLKELRLEKGLTQGQLAEQINVSNRSVSRWETGNTLPDISILIELAEFYETDIKEIIDGERKSEKTNNEIKETLVKIADYTDIEKNSIIKKLSNNLIGIALDFLGLLVILGFELNEKYANLEGLPIFLSYLGLIFTGSGIIQILQINGNMNKQCMKKVGKLLLPIIIGVMLIMVIAIILLIYGIFE